MLPIHFKQEPITERIIIINSHRKLTYLFALLSFAYIFIHIEIPNSNTNTSLFETLQNFHKITVTMHCKIANKLL